MKLPRHPALYDRKRKWKLDSQKTAGTEDTSPAQVWMSNYKSARDPPSHIKVVILLDTYYTCEGVNDDEEPQNEPGTSSTSQPIVPVLPHYQGPAASSQGPAASANSGDEDSENSDEYSAQSQDSGRTVLCPDLYVPSNDEHWTMTPETHKYAAAARSFFFVTTENGDNRTCAN